MRWGSIRRRGRGHVLDVTSSFLFGGQPALKALEDPEFSFGSISLSLFGNEERAESSQRDDNNRGAGFNLLPEQFPHQIKEVAGGVDARGVDDGDNDHDDTHA